MPALGAALVRAGPADGVVVEDGTEGKIDEVEADEGHHPIQFSHYIQFKALGSRFQGQGYA